MLEDSPFGSLAQFQLQGQEQKHQTQTAIMYRATNMKGNKCEAVARREVALMFFECNLSLLANNIPCRTQKKLGFETCIKLKLEM